MKTLVAILSIVLGSTLTVVGQNYMGMSQSKIIKSMGEPDKVGTNYYIYTSLDEYGQNIYYFDESGNCSSFEIVRNISHLDDYQKILKREFKEACLNKYVKKTKKMNYLAELILMEDTFQIKIQDTNGNDTSCGQMLAGVQVR